MNNGCKQCAKLGSDELCIDCKIEQADADVWRAMNVLERLKQQQKLKQERELKWQTSINTETQST